MRIVLPAPQIGAREYYTRIGRWYGGSNSNTSSNLTVVANKLYGMPLLVARVQKPDSIGISITTGAVGFVRVGLYSDDGTIWPGSLLADSGALVTDNIALMTAALSGITLIPGNLYWIAALFNATPQVSGYSGGAVPKILGASDATWDTGYFAYETQAYGALPATFPKTPSMQGTGGPSVLLRYPV